VRFAVTLCLHSFQSLDRAVDIAGSDCDFRVRDALVTAVAAHGAACCESSSCTTVSLRYSVGSSTEASRLHTAKNAQSRP